jgi:protein-tyrosine phosphatase
MIKTSATHPIEVGFVDAGVVGGPGAIGFTIAPGKRWAAADGHAWQRDLDTDLARIRQAHAINVVVSLLEPNEQHRLGIRNYARTAHRHGLELVKFPIPDAGVPDPAALRALAERLSAMLDRGSRLLVHCRGGLGRSGLVVAAVLVARGVAPDRAIRAVRSARPGAIETEEQARMVHAMGETSARDDRAAPAVQQWFRGLRLGHAERIDGLDAFPVIVAGGVPAVPWLLAPEAIEQSLLSVAEMPNAAIVQRLLAANHGDVEVLVLEGETLVGCKQNPWSPGRSWCLQRARSCWKSDAWSKAAGTTSPATSRPATSAWKDASAAAR